MNKHPPEGEKGHNFDKKLVSANLPQGIVFTCLLLRSSAYWHASLQWNPRPCKFLVCSVSSMEQLQRINIQIPPKADRNLRNFTKWIYLLNHRTNIVGYGIYIGIACKAFDVLRYAIIAHVKIDIDTKIFLFIPINV